MVRFIWDCKNTHFQLLRLNGPLHILVLRPNVSSSHLTVEYPVKALGQRLWGVEICPAVARTTEESVPPSMSVSCKGDSLDKWSAGGWAAVGYDE